MSANRKPIGEDPVNRVAPESVSPEVAAKIASWRPREIDPDDAAAVVVVLPVVKSWVVAVQPNAPRAAAKLLWATTRMVLWWQQQGGNLDAVEMLTLRHIQQFVVVVNADRSPKWRHSVRSLLRRVARTVNPDQWPHLEDCVNRAEFEALAPEVAAKIVSWVPRNLGPEDDAVVEIVLPDVRSWVAAANPSTPGTAGKMLFATTLIALWWHQRFGNLDPASMLKLPNIEHFVTVVNAGRTHGWQHNARCELRRVAQTVNPSQWPNRDIGPESESLPPEVAEMIATWMPKSLSAQHAAELNVVLPEVRAWVTAASPDTSEAARNLLWATTRIAIWALETVGSADSSILNPRNVDVWATVVNSHRSKGWRTCARSLLRRVGRAANPQGWPEVSPVVGSQAVSSPYTADEEAAFLLAAGLPGAANRVGRLWAAGASLGAGMNGTEILAAQVSDVREVAGDRLAVQVRGRNERLVPIRACCTQTVRRAISLASEQPPETAGRFIFSDRLADASKIANQISIGDQFLHLRRARSTWVAAHLLAGTPLPMLQKIAGSLAASTLDQLCAALAVSIDAEQAVMDGLRA